MSDQDRIYDYLIVGAGPGGIQMGYYFEKADRDYLILERSNEAGSFFRKFPRHRKLISINKKYLGQLEERENVDHAEVALRYDWNSLLCDDPEFRFTKYTDDYFPDADLYVDYLNDYVKKYGIKIDYGVEVRKISKVKPESNKGMGIFGDIDEEIFHLVCNDTERIYRCRNLIMATGLSKPNIPDDIPGIEHAIGYEEMDMDRDKYKNKHILIMGTGNSAFEVAEWLTPVVGFLNVTGRTPVKMAWKTHYVGDVRAINNNFLDTFQLKSNVILDYYDNHSIKVNGNKFKYRDDIFDYDYIFRCLGFVFDRSIFDATCLPELEYEDKIPKIDLTYQSTNINKLYFIGTNAQAYDYKKSSSAFIHGFRYTAKFLFNYLENSNHGIRLEKNPIKIRSQETMFRDITNYIIDIINESSAIFQLFQHYCYLIILEENLTCLKDPIPINFIAQLRPLINDGGIIMITMEYNFEDDEDVFQPFPIFDRFNGIQSRFLHPVIRYFPSYKSFMDRKNIKEYGLCMCGHWEESNFLKRETICDECVKKGYCFCGNTETVEYFTKHDRCSRCNDNNPCKLEELEEISVNIKRPQNCYYVHHVAEDISVAFKRGGNFSDYDLHNVDPLVRFLKSIFLDYVIPCTRFYHEQFLVAFEDKNRELPHQFRFWTFFSYIFLRCPSGRERIVESLHRQRYLYNNNRQIKNAILNTFRDLYPNDLKQTN